MSGPIGTQFEPVYATMLKLRRTTLIEKMKKLMIERPAQSENPGNAAE